jgi:hypothetical protein
MGARDNTTSTNNLLEYHGRSNVRKILDTTRFIAVAQKRAVLCD